MTQLRDHVLEKVSNLSEQWLLLLLLAAVLTATRFVERAGSEQLALTHIHSLRNQVFRHFLRLPPKAAQRINRGGLLMRLTGDLGAIRTWIIQGLVPIMTLSVWLGVATISLLMLDPTLVVLMMTLLALAVPVYWICGRALYRSSGNVRQQRARLISYTTEKISGVSLILSMNQAGRESRRFERLSHRLLKQQKHRALWVGLLRALTELTSLLLVGTLALAGYYRIENGSITMDQFVMITVFGLYLLPQLRRLGRVYEYWTLYRLACHKLERFMARKAHTDQGKKLEASVGEPVSIEIALPPPHPLVLTASAHTRVLLHDPADSLLPALKAGLQGGDVANMEFRINGVPIETLSATEQKRRVVIIDSYPMLWSGTVKHNLTYGMRRGGDEELERAVDVCGLTSTIERLEEGLETRIRPYAHPFSDQECFAIQVCRALLRKPSLILIDHPILRRSLSEYELMRNVERYFTGTLILASETTETPADWVDTVWDLSSTDLHETIVTRDPIDARVY
ncbi:ABC transporter transmembrane domain-containing protein [Marinobacterium sediminicola]|uniref:ABC-type multidrug transport system, ATPase and permease component n=1 Tax=Marinobacterium sediminicola TaxID=518898 RepID=A0ABY1RXR9_9GAMM|nr:ABC transporter ATP-binding protein [Marinobacterium sediminicola]ULG68579.1 ABC transporter ATP-binding protein/permease [Marinobacterium sediminicola]SMR73097.1 ABC-type multidrug transport system, ATPase and permease component [Marinobacterium sediminicola]